MIRIRCLPLTCLESRLENIWSNGPPPVCHASQPSSHQHPAWTEILTTETKWHHLSIHTGSSVMMPTAHYEKMLTSFPLESAFSTVIHNHQNRAQWLVRLQKQCSECVGGGVVIYNIPLSSVAAVPLYKLLMPPSLKSCLAQSTEPAYFPLPGEDCWIYKYTHTKL